MTNPLEQIAKAGLTEQIECEQLSAVQLALKTQVVFCDTLKGKGLPVRAVRAWQGPKNKPTDISGKAPEWTDYAEQARLKGYEVFTLEGWSVPERVYYVVKESR